MVDIADSADKCLGQQWRFPITGGYKLVTQVSRYSSWMLYHLLAAVYLDTTTLTSDHILLLILAAFGFRDNC